jgi:hypothetical protein
VTKPVLNLSKGNPEALATAVRQEIAAPPLSTARDDIFEGFPSCPFVSFVVEKLLQLLDVTRH